MYVLNGQLTNNSYPNEPGANQAILVCPGAVRVNIRTTLNQVTCQMALRSSGGGLKGTAAPWGPDVNLGRSIQSLDRNVEAIRFKSTTPGSPGQVDVTAMTKEEISG